MKSDCTVKSYKYLAKCLVLVLILGPGLFLFSGCGDKDTGDKDAGNQTTVEDQEQTTGDDATEEKATSQDSQDSQDSTTTSDSKTSTDSKDSDTTTKSDSKSDTGSTSSDTNTDSSSSTSTTKTCTIQINCSLLVGKDLTDTGLETLVPANGIILKTTTVTLQSGDTVYDVTRRITKSKKIQLSTQGTASLGTLYVDGISNIYEKAYNSKSGWIYLVNGKKPGISCGSQTVKAKDKIVWGYSLNLGNDL